jgi:hypothetical protein
MAAPSSTRRGVLPSTDPGTNIGSVRYGDRMPPRFAALVQGTPDEPASRPVEGARHISLPRWTAACTAGELLGFGVGGVLGALAFGSIPDPNTPILALLLVTACVGAGLIEGTILGLLQWLALRSTFRTIPPRAWVGATALAGAAGWFLGSLPPTLISLLGAGSSGATVGSEPAWDPGPLEVVLASAALGLVLGSIFGAFQWLALRRHAVHAGRWIGANALAWMFALPWSYVAGSSVATSSPPGVLIAVAVGTGVLMGVSVALITGLFLRRIVPVDPRRPSPAGAAS